MPVALEKLGWRDWHVYLFHRCAAAYPRRECIQAPSALGRFFARTLVSILRVRVIEHHEMIQQAVWSMVLTHDSCLWAGRRKAHPKG